MDKIPDKCGVLIVLSGPSGAGKSSILSQVMKQRENLRFSISCTTRSPRPGEEHGKAYYFLTKEDFESRITAGEFLEHACVHGNYYGTLKSEVTDRLLKNQDVVLDIDVQGAMILKQLCAEDPLLSRCAEFVFVSPPSTEVLEQRLRGRGTETEEVILRRLANAKGEIAKLEEYSYLIINDQLENAVSSFLAMYDTFKLSLKRWKGAIQ
ncbi:MAG: guanylate kinase [Lentisphaeria bacterium]|nr:guanylate kinase [Lentisphaeria bacterium]